MREHKTASGFKPDAFFCFRKLLSESSGPVVHDSVFGAAFFLRGLRFGREDESAEREGNM